MPDAPEQTPDLNTQLQALQYHMADIGIELDVVIKFHREGSRILQLLPNELRQLNEQIVRLLPLLP
jgi:hypothetical protein